MTGMAVVVTRACRPYWAYQLHELAEGTVIPAGEFADYLLATGAPVEEQADSAGEASSPRRPSSRSRKATDAEDQG